MFEGLNLTPLIVVLCILSALVGWGVIEGVLWLIEHIDIVWVTTE